MSLTALDLFSAAAGGWSLGLHRAGIRTVAACESVEWRRILYAENNTDVRLYDDVRTLTADRLVRDLGWLPDIIVGSPPCPEFSSVNTKRRGRGLEVDDCYLHAVRVVGECRPRWAAFENSAELRTVGYDRIASELEALGYSCWPVVVGAGNAGAPHRRQRSIVLASDLSQEQGRFAGQPRPNGRVAVAADADEEGHHAQPVDGQVAGMVGSRRAAWESSALDPERSLGPAGSQPLGRHLREYDGLPAGLAEQCRQAYGDAVLPQIPEAVGRAILRTEAALSAVYGAAA